MTLNLCIFECISLYTYKVIDLYIYVAYRGEVNDNLTTCNSHGRSSIRFCFFYNAFVCPFLVY